MVLTQLQTTAFFENPDQLGIPHETMVQIQREGIQAVADLADFEKQELQQLADNLRKPGGRIPDPNPISSVMDPTPNTTKMPSIGKTGVHLRYYKTGEYRNLTNKQKEELKEWRANNPNTFKAGSKKAKKENPKKSKQSMKKQVASLVEAALNKSVKFDDQVNDEEKYIMSMVQAAVTKTLEQKSDQKSQEKPKVSQKSVLKHAKNNGSS